MKTSSANSGRIHLRRNSDLSRIVFFYCTVGLILCFAQIAFSAEEVCAETYSEIENSKSAVLKKIISVVQNQNFTNLDKTSHVKFGGGDRLQLAIYTTTKKGELKVTEGTMTICEKDGVLTVSSILSKFPAKVVFKDECVSVVGALGILAGSNAEFCRGEMPSQIQAALQRDTQLHAAAHAAVQPGTVLGFLRR